MRRIESRKVETPVLADIVGEGLATVEVEVVHDQVNSFGARIAADDLTEHGRQLGCRASRSRKGEVPAGLGSTAQNTLAVPQRLYSLSRLAAILFT